MTTNKQVKSKNRSPDKNMYKSIGESMGHLEEISRPSAAIPRTNMPSSMSHKRVSADHNLKQTQSTAGTGSAMRASKIAAGRRSRMLNSDMMSLEVTQRPTTSEAIMRRGDRHKVSFDQIGTGSMTLIPGVNDNIRPVTQ